MRQQTQVRQLEATRMAEQRIIQERLRVQQQAQAARSTEREMTVQLGTYVMVNIGGSNYRIAVHDDGPDEIRVIVDYHQPVRFQKRSGFEDRDIETLILSNGGSRLYYVNTISDHIGHCLLRLRDE
jgi:hypothetical protein